jgi:hypothetical protein
LAALASIGLFLVCHSAALKVGRPTAKWDKTMFGRPRVRPIQRQVFQDDDSEPKRLVRWLVFGNGFTP